MIVANALLISAVLAVTTWTSRWLGFSRHDDIAVVFCGSKKSLAAGLPTLNIFFPAGMVGLMMVPLILFHQVQLMVCASLARRYAERAKPARRTIRGLGTAQEVRS